MPTPTQSPTRTVTKRFSGAAVDTTPNGKAVGVAERRQARDRTARHRPRRRTGRDRTARHRSRRRTGRDRTARHRPRRRTGQDRSARHRPAGRPARPARRRSNWAAVMEHMVPGGSRMSDADLELWTLEILRGPRAA